jgi:hypothetical protein
METLGGLLVSIEQSNSEQQRQLQGLSELLQNSENELTISRQAITGLQSVSETQGELLNSLQYQLEQRRLISEAQLSYTRKLQTRSKILTVSLLVALPAAVVGTAWVTYKLVK